MKKEQFIRYNHYIRESFLLDTFFNEFSAGNKDKYAWVELSPKEKEIKKEAIELFMSFLNKYDELMTSIGVIENIHEMKQK